MLMDLQMDVTEGLEATRQIRGWTSWLVYLNAQIPIVNMPAYAMARGQERFLQTGRNDHGAKTVPFAAIQKMLGREISSE